MSRRSSASDLGDADSGELHQQLFVFRQTVKQLGVELLLSNKENAGLLPLPSCHAFGFHLSNEGFINSPRQLLPSEVKCEEAPLKIMLELLAPIPPTHIPFLIPSMAWAERLREAVMTISSCSSLCRDLRRVSNQILQTGSLSKFVQPARADLSIGRPRKHPSRPIHGRNMGVDAGTELKFWL